MSRSGMEGAAGRWQGLLAGGLALGWLAGALLAPCGVPGKRAVVLVALGAALLLAAHARIERWRQVASLTLLVALVAFYLLGRDLSLRVSLGGSRELRLLPVQAVLGLGPLVPFLVPCMGRRFVLEGYVVSAGLLLLVVAWVNGLAVGTRYPVDLLERLVRLSRAVAESSLCALVASCIVVRLGPARTAARRLGSLSLLTGIVLLLLGTLAGGVADVS